MSATAVHVSANALFQLLHCEVMTPQQIAEGLLILPTDYDWLIYMGTRDRRPPGQSTIPDDDGSSRLVRAIDARMRAARDDATLVRHGIRPDITFTEALDRLAQTAVMAQDQGNLLWYPRGLVHRWFLQLRRDPSWWTTLRRHLPNSRFPRDPGRMCMFPTDPDSWAKVLHMYANVTTQHMPSETTFILDEDESLPKLNSLSA